MDIMKPSAREIGAAAAYDAYQTSSAQKRLYLINQLYGDSVLYNINSAWVIEGKLNVSLLEKALKKLVERHETLRTSFALKDGKVFQKVFAAIDVELKYHTPGETTDDIDANRLLEEFLQPFDLDQVPLWRAEVIRLGPEKYFLLFDIHHIISDGVSMNVLISEMAALYSGVELPPLDFQYVDFTMWQNKMSGSEQMKKQEEYWLKVFAGELPLLDIPYDYSRPLEADIAGRTVKFELNTRRTAAVNQLALENKTTLYVVLLAVYNVLLSRYTGQEDIIVGSPISGRTHKEFEPIIGMFVNTLALRNRPLSHLTFEHFLERVSKNVFAAFNNQDYPFEMLVEKLVPRRHLNRNPLIDTMLALQNLPKSIEMTEGNGVNIKSTLRIIPYPHHEKVAKFDLTLIAHEEDRHLIFIFEYRTSLFREDTIERMIGHFKNIVHCVCENPRVPLAGIDILNPEEKQLLLYDFNRTDTDFPTDKTVHRLFEEQAGRTPDGVALVGSWQGVAPPADKGAVGKKERSAEPVQLTYKELNKRADQLAHVLRDKGVGPDSIVGLMMGRSLEMIVGILGILKSGAAYLPIDPGYPRERIDYMLADSSAKILLSELSKVSGLSKEPTHLTHPTHPTHPTHLCYVIYTSGTTGKPKGVMIEHRSLVNLCFWHNRYYRVTGQDRTIQYAAFGFDASVWEVFPYFLAGAEIHIISDAVKPDIGALREYFEKNRITIAFLPTQVSEQFMDTEQGREIRNHSLRKVLTGGDKLSRFIKQDYDLYNNYGPTENTVVTTAFKVEDYRDNIPIGNPIYNHRVYILNTGGDGLHLQPIGVPGELCITGAGVSRGYLNRPELTAEKFLFADYRSYKSYRTYISQKIYKTGDLARWMVDGNIQFLGRMDHQVKLRGYRIEPGEIEDRLLRHGHIEEAVVIDRKNRAGEIYLCAYIVVKAGEDSSSASRLREYLSRSLPAYMIPAYFVLLEKLPLNPSGKVDKKALPEPAAGSGDRDKYTAPRDEVEEKLAAIWAEVLGRDPSHPSIGIDDNFFERGGHSLKATILLAGIYKAFEVKVPMPELFRAPTIRELAKNIREAVKEGFHSIDSCEEREYYKVSSVQRRLFFLQQVNPDNMSYNIPMFLALEGEYDLERLEKALRGLIERHESLRTSFLSIEGEPVQRVHRPGDVEFTLEYHEFPGLLEGDARDFGEAVRELARPGSAAARVVDDFVRPFDLSLPPLMRLGLIVPDRRRLIFMIDIHHSISDGTSQGIFAGELIALYKGEEPAPLRLQYRDFSRWFDSEEHQRQIRQQENYWLKRFSGEIPLLNLPADFERPAVQTFEGASVHFDIGRDRLRALKKLAAEEEATLYIVMLAIFNVTLSRLTGGEDIIVGASLAGRRHPDLEKIIGMFINALALRNYPAGDKTFIEFLGEVKQNTIKDFENQDYQFENLVDRIAVERVPGRNPLFDAMMVLNNEEKTRTDIPGLKIGGFPSENKAAQMDLKLRLEEIGENLFCSFEYSTSLFKKETVGMFAKNIKEVLDRVMEDREVRIKDVKITHGLLSTKVDTSRMSFEF